MTSGEREDENVLPMEAAAAGGEGLPYVVELWDLPRAAPERILGRAATMVLAGAVFTAAQSEHLGRRLVLRRGDKVIRESA